MDEEEGGDANEEGQRMAVEEFGNGRHGRSAGFAFSLEAEIMETEVPAGNSNHQTATGRKAKPSETTDSQSHRNRCHTSGLH